MEAAPPEGYEWGFDTEDRTDVCFIDELVCIEVPNLEMPNIEMPNIEIPADLLDLDMSEERQRVSERRRSLLRRWRVNNAESASAPLLTRCLAEVVGTAWIFLSGSLVASSGLKRWFPLVALAWGAAVGTAVSAFGALSGGHFNPAVTVSMLAGDSFSFWDVIPYLAAQYTGAMLASVALLVAVGPAVLPAVSPTAMQAEIGVAAVLLYVCNAIGDGVESGRVAKRTSPFLVGLLIATLNLAFSQWGAGINPAMSAGPRLVSWALGGGRAALAGARAFTLGPILGGVLGSCIFAIGSGRGHGLYRLCAWWGRNFSPWYGEHWEKVPEATSKPAVRVPDLQTLPRWMRGVVVPTRRRPRPVRPELEQRADEAAAELDLWPMRSHMRGVVVPTRQPVSDEGAQAVGGALPQHAAK